MILPLSALVFQEKICCYLNKLRVEINTYLGRFADVYYFTVILHNPGDYTDISTNNQVRKGKSGLLRVGNTDGALSRELQLRQTLGNFKMISELLASVIEESVYVSSRLSSVENQNHDKTNTLIKNEQVLITESENIDQNSKLSSEYLEDQLYDNNTDYESSGQMRILLSYLPSDEESLATWLTKTNSLESCLLITSQVCQFFRFVSQRQWSFIQIFPKFIEIGTPVQFFDLTGAYPVGEHLAFGLMADYCAPELAYDSSCTIGEQMSAYTVGCLLHQAIHHQLPPQELNSELQIQPIPRIYQIIKTCLSRIPEERFPLSQLLNFLVEIRQSMGISQVYWEVASDSTVGLSLNRLQNEDSYGVRRQELSNSESLILGVVADGMGGMAQGEVASKFAVQTILEAPLPADLTNHQKRAQWLTSLVQQANECIANKVQDGGTTLSLVMILGQELMIAHVGDSRIFLLRKGRICQLSEDHSMVAMLFASGQITYEEILDHPERNILTKSLGSTRKLSEGYIQDLSRFGSELLMPVENGDILILCSDGVWDLVPADELAEIFQSHETLQSAVNSTTAKVLKQGAHDNATIVALKCCVKKY